MRTSQHFASLLLLMTLLMAATATALADDPGAPVSPNSPISDQKAGSVLFYNLYSSNATNPAAENTRINITNTSATSSVSVHLFFIDGLSCAPADMAICLTPNQTASFVTADVDPGTMGYLVAVAVDGNTGCPVSFNFLIGDEYVKLATGHAANLGAEAVAAMFEGIIQCDQSGATADLIFDGNFNGLCSYNALPRVLAVDNIPSPADGNSILLVINNPSGDFTTSGSSVGAVFGILYDDAETPLSFTFSSGLCQVKQVLSNSFPRVAFRLSSVIPSGRSGWIKFWSATGRPLLGAAINFNSMASTLPQVFNQGHNLHKLTLQADPAAVIRIPLFPSGC